MVKWVIIVKTNNLEQRSKQVLQECIESIPFVELRGQIGQGNAQDKPYDFMVNIIIKGKSLNLIVEVKNNGEPRNARQAVNQLLRYKKNLSDVYGILIAPYISQQAADICIDAGIGYIDLSGNCYLSFENVFIHKEGKPNLFSTSRSLRSLYSPKAERILRVLMINGPKDWKIEELAKEADVSIGLVAKVKKLLLDREWVNTKRIGFSLVKPFNLLQDWASNYKFDRNETYDFYTMLDIPEIEQRLSEESFKSGIEFGLTGFSGAIRLAPMVRYQRAWFYINTDIEQLTNKVDLKPVSSGANVTIMKPYDEGVFYNTQNVDGMPIVSAVQIYLDLMKIRGRGEEAANAVLERVIRKIW